MGYESEKLEVLRLACETVLEKPREVTTEGDILHFHGNIESPRVAGAIMDLFHERDRLHDALKDIAEADPDAGKKIIGRKPCPHQESAKNALDIKHFDSGGRTNG